MKIGDIVIVNDGSWSAEFKDGKLVDAFANIDHMNKIRRKWKVLAVNCKLPIAGTTYDIDYQFNDIIISPCDEPERIVFINSEFLSPVKPQYCSQCGAELTKYCSQCGAELTKYCSYCGAEIKEDRK